MDSVLNLFKKKDERPPIGTGKYMPGIGGTNAAQRPINAPTAAKPRAVVRGEINDLIAEFNKANSLKDVTLMRKLLGRVVKYMTIGFDVSPLFTYIVNAAASPDMLVKKLSYLYLVTTSKLNEDLSILAINSFLKDCNDSDPKIRGLAIRSLTSLRVPSVIEYMMAPIGQCLKDRSPYVRRCAVMGLLKAYHIDNSVVLDSGLLQSLGTLMQDSDAQVVVNVIRVLTELGVEFEVDAAVVHPLLNRLGEFNEWCLCTVLDLLSRYRPLSSDETFNIMNMLEPVFRQHNTAVILAVVRCYLKFTTDMPEITSQVYERMKQPMLTLMANPNFELSYCILTHLKLMLQRDPSAFLDEYRQFYVRYNEPPSIQQLKLEILPLLATDYNFMDICTELIEYTLGPFENVSRESVCSMAQLSVLIPEALDIVQATLLDLLDVEKDHVRAETICSFQDIVRRYPNKVSDIVPLIPMYIRKLHDTNARVAGLWLLGAYPNEAEDAPYYVETLINDYESLETSTLKLQLLTTTLKLFFERAPEMESMLGRLFESAFKDRANPMVIDRALLYYRLLSTDVSAAKRVIVPNTVVQSDFNQKDKAKEETLFSEFNTLAVVYQKPSAHFVFDSTSFSQTLSYEGGEDAEEEVEADDSVEMSIDADSSAGAALDDFAQQAQPQVPSSSWDSQPVASSMASDPFSDFGSPVSAQSGNSAFDMFDGMMVSAMSAPTPSLQLVAANSINPPSFQRYWMSLQDSVTESVTMRSLNVDHIGQTVESSRISLMASGDKGTMLQFFFYGQDAMNSLYFASIQLDKASQIAKVAVRNTGGDANAFCELLKRALASC